MDDMNKLYQQGLENLAKSTAAIPVHLQQAGGALAWWQEDTSLMAKAQMPWDKKDEEEAEEEDEEHDKKEAKSKKDDDTDESDDDADEDEEEDGDVKKSVGDDMVRMRQRGYDRETSDLSSFVNTDGPAYANMIAKDEIKGNPESLARYKGMKRSSNADTKKRGEEGYEYNRARRAAARNWLDKSLDELSAITAQLEGKGEEDASPLLKSIDALNRLAGN